MKRYMWVALLLVAFVACNNVKESASGFVQVKDGSFYINDEPYVFKGANYWQGMNLGAPLSGNKSRMIQELNQLKAMGVTNLRVLAASEGDTAMKFAIHPALQTAPGVYNEDLWLGLDVLLSEMAKRDMKAVMVLGNFWTWSGGFPQYIKWADSIAIPYPQYEGNSWDDFQRFSANFYVNEKAKEMLKNHIKTVIERVNSVTNTQYKDDPTIMAWQLANEPRGVQMIKEFRKWTRETTSFIKSLDANHLVCLGTEGNTASDFAGVNVLVDNDDANVDYISMHIWAQNWGWFKPTDGEEVYQETLQKVDNYWNDHVTAAQKLHKPIVLEEFGIARDSSSFNPESTTYWRDRFYQYLLDKVTASVQNNEPVKGFNFWSYSGEGRPPRPGQYWQKGDTFIGDPPHELQGWYGVYNEDSTTINVVKDCKLTITK